VDAGGDVVWTRELGMFPMNADFGTGSALATAAGNVFVQCDNDESSFVAAFRMTDGEPAWRVERPKGSAWASPIAWTRGEVADLVVCGPGTVTGYAPESGEVRWVVDVGGTFSSSPAIDGDLLIVGNSGRMQRGPLLAIDASVEGEVDAKESGADGPIAWNVGRAGPSFASPVAVNGMVWVINSQGILTCRDAATGEELYDERLPDARSVVSCPWTDGENVYILGEGGQTYVVAAAPEYELVATNEIEGTFWSTPSAAGGSLLLRSADSLICIRAAD
jgi:outer membrane protein assembly factor BamB